MKDKLVRAVQPAFATFLHGSFASVQRKLKKTAAQWVAQYRKDGTFPRAEEADVEPGSTVPTSDASDLDRTSNLWRIYFVRALLSTIKESLEWKDHNRVGAVFDDHVHDTSWGALDIALGHAAPNTLENVARRLEALVRFWPELETLRYIGRDARRSLSLSEIVAEHYDLALATWGGGSTGDAQSLLKAVRAMRAVSPDAAEERARESMFNMAATDPRIKNRDTLTDRGNFDEAWSSILTEEERLELTGLHVGTLKRALYVLDEEIGNSSASKR